MRYKTTIEIDCPVAEVFRVVATDFVDSYPKYCLQAARVDIQPPGPLAVGTTGTITGRMPSGLHSVDFKVTAYEPGRLLSFESSYRGMSSRGTYFFDTTWHDKTKLTIIDEIDEGGVRAWLFLLTKPFVSAGARADARRLKELIESGKPPSGRETGSEA
jgi:Polyketide cyclase / dehydrase and lipid transport